MTDPRSDSSPEVSYGLALANESYNWYKSHAIRSRRLYKISETTLIVLSAAIPLSVAVAPHQTTLTAVLGAAVVVLTGTHSVFHWQDNFLRFSHAREAVEAERRLYHTGAPPYDDPATSDQLLAAAVTRIERSEMEGWIKIAAERPKI